MTLLMTTAHEKYSRNTTTAYPLCVLVDVGGAVCKSYFFNKGGMSSPAPMEEQPHVPIYVGDQSDSKQLCQEGP